MQIVIWFLLVANIVFVFINLNAGKYGLAAFSVLGAVALISALLTRLRGRQ
jgi:hypothetical protein